MALNFTWSKHCKEGLMTKERPSLDNQVYTDFKNYKSADLSDFNNDVRTKSMLLISVIIPHFNDLNNLDECLRLLAAQTIAADRFEVIVADNNSRCGFVAVREMCSDRAIVVPAPLQGAGEARNAGVKASRGRYLAFIDSDCRPANDWLECGIAALAVADMVGGRVDIEFEDEKNITPVEAFEAVFAFNFKRYIEKQGFSGSGNMFVPRHIFEKVGGFRLGVSEDVDWGRRAVAMGFRWKYAPNVKVSHPARREWEDLCRKWRRVIRESYMLAKNSPMGRVHWMLRSWLVLFSPVIHVMNVLRSPRLVGLGNRLNAIGILFRIRWWRFVESHRVLIGDLLST